MGMTALEELTRHAQYVAVSIREYIAGEWDGNVVALGAMAEHLEHGIDRASKEIALGESVKGTSLE